MGKFEVEVTVKLAESVEALLTKVFGAIQVNQLVDTKEVKKKTATKKEVKVEEVPTNEEVELTTNDVKEESKVDATELRAKLSALAMEKRRAGHDIKAIIVKLGASQFKELPDEKLIEFEAELNKL